MADNIGITPGFADSWGGAWGKSWGASWGKTKVEEFARSGYWRLFYYNLQAEELAKREQEQREAAPQVEGEITAKAESGAKQTTVVYAKPSKTRKKAKQTLVESTYKKQAILQAPAYVEPELPWLLALQIIQELRFTVVPYRAILSTPSRLAEAANDEDLEVLLLLSA